MFKMLRNNKGIFTLVVGAVWFFIGVVGTLAYQDYKNRHQDKPKTEDAKPLIIG